MEKKLKEKEEELDEQQNEELEEVVEEYEEIAEDSPFQNPVVRYGLIGAVLVLVAAGGWFGYSYFQDKNEKEASLALSRVSPYYQQGYYNEALNGLGNQVLIRGSQVQGLKTIADTYSSTETGKLAALYAGNIMSFGGDFGSAERYYDQASGASAPITKMGGLAGKASCKAQGKNYVDAAKLYEEAAAVGENVGESERFNLYAAMNYEKAGQKDAALKLFKRLAEATEYSEIVAEAKIAVVRLGGAQQ
jgi:tetratricopeptide (TPR) repeat protein